jgi:hypothetical protein
VERQSVSHLLENHTTNAPVLVERRHERTGAFAKAFWGERGALRCRLSKRGKGSRRVSARADVGVPASLVFFPGRRDIITTGPVGFLCRWLPG